MIEEDPKGKFEGVWIPAALFNAQDLTFTEKVMLGYMISFKKKCFASDLHIANRLGTTEQVVANMFTRLRKKGWMIGRTPNLQVRLDLTQELGGPNPGVSIEQRIEQREMKKNNAATPGHFVPDSEGAVRVLVSVVVDRGFAEADVRRELDIMLKEVRAGITVPPGNWAAYLAARCHKEIGKRKRAARAAPPPPKPASQFSVVHT